MRARHRTAAAVLLAPLLVVPLAGPAAARGWGGDDSDLAASTAVAWQRSAIRTIYTDGAKAPPDGALYLAFTSLAVHDAAVDANRHGSPAAAAAVATAAHDVLLEYFPAGGAKLAADLAASLAMVPDGKKKALGVAIGAKAADKMIASRVNDGRNNVADGPPVSPYAKAPAPGVWQPPATGMALYWLGFVDPVIDIKPVVLDGPDPLTSWKYARDYEEVRKVGELNAPLTDRSQEQTDIAKFFAAASVTMYREAVCNMLAADPIGLLATTRLFARIDAAVATVAIQTWRLKYEVGFWRPFQAIAAATTDDNDATQPHPTTWAPLVPNPAYSDYTSGHAAMTSPFAQVMRRTFGDRTPLVLTVGGVTRSYATLSALEHDALNARIWGGLHFRDAMEDGYYLGHKTANRVMRAISDGAERDWSWRGHRGHHDD
ncbi:MAG TPA: vanadium-dependent haloperoxidase [Candidatus Nanopelagicales bacterium]